MTLLDASVIVDALRAKDVQLMSKMNAVSGAVCGVTRAEIFAGARGLKDRAKLLTILDGFQQVSIPDTMWDEVGDVQAQLRAGGVTVPLADAVLTTVALALDVELWARDTDFNHIHRVLPALKLYRENP
jgi:predicted nucleic acid-binding protein